MRSSVLKSDPGYKNFVRNRGRAVVYLNGEPVPLCVTADEELETVVVYEIDEHNRFVLENGRLVMRELYGKVEIRQTSRNEFEEHCKQMAHWGKAGVFVKEWEGVG